MLSYLDSRWLLLMEGLGMHKMGRKLMIFAFFFDSRGAFQMDTPAWLASLVLRNTKRYFGVACMMEWAGENFISGIAELFDAA